MRLNSRRLPARPRKIGNPNQQTMQQQVNWFADQMCTKDPTRAAAIASAIQLRLARRR